MVSQFSSVQTEPLPIVSERERKINIFVRKKERVLVLYKTCYGVTYSIKEMTLY